MVPAGRYKLSYRINNELRIFIRHLFPAGRFPNSATNTNAQPLAASLTDTHRMTGIIKKTTYRQLDKIGRPDIFIKLECDQFAGSFKSRGIVHFLSQIDNPKGLVTFTTGNHGISVSAIARQLSLPAIIITTDRITNYKQTIIENSGATVQLIDFYNFDKATALAKQTAKDLDYTFVPLYGNYNLLEGYSKIADEICTDFEGNLTMLFPVGTGSLLYSNAKRAKAINPNNKIIGVEPEVYQRLNGIAHHNGPSSSIADSLAIDRIPTCNLELTKFTDNILTIKETEIANATKLIYEQFSLVTEAGGAITLAAALKTERDNIKKVAIITGKNISTEKFHFITSNFHSKR